MGWGRLRTDASNRGVPYRDVQSPAVRFGRMWTRTLMAAARAVAVNPAPARLVGRAWDWPHAGVERASHPAATAGSFSVLPLIDRRRASPIVSTWDADDPAFAALRRSDSIGRPLGDDAFLEAISRRLNRVVTARKRGRKPKGDVA